MDNIDDTKLAELKHTLNDPLESDNDSVIETSEIYDDGEFEEGELDHDDDDDDDDEKDETEDVENVTNQSNDLDNDIEDKLKEDMDEYMDVNMGMNVEDDDESEINSTNNDLENENESSDDDYDDDDDDEDELYLFDDEYKNDQINNNHTLLKVNNMHEIKALCMILRDINNKIVDDHHKTIPLLTKYEKAKILGVRANQINNGCKSFIETTDSDIDGYLIAEQELYQKKNPFIIKRPLPSGINEYWYVNDLEFI